MSGKTKALLAMFAIYAAMITLVSIFVGAEWGALSGFFAIVPIMLIAMVIDFND